MVSTLYWQLLKQHEMSLANWNRSPGWAIIGNFTWFDWILKNKLHIGHFLFFVGLFEICQPFLFCRSSWILFIKWLISGKCDPPGPNFSPFLPQMHRYILFSTFIILSCPWNFPKVSAFLFQSIESVQQSEWETPITLIWKSDVSVPICGDYRLTVSLVHWPPPRYTEYIVFNIDAIKMCSAQHYLYET